MMHADDTMSDDLCIAMRKRFTSYFFTVHETGELERLFSCTTISLDRRETNLLTLSLISILASDSLYEPVLILSPHTTFPVRSCRGSEIITWTVAVALPIS